MSLVGAAASTLGGWVSLISTGARTTSNGGRSSGAGRAWGACPSAARRGSCSAGAGSTDSNDVGRLGAARCGSGVGRACSTVSVSANEGGSVIAGRDSSGCGIGAGASVRQSIGGGGPGRAGGGGGG